MKLRLTRDAASELAGIIRTIRDASPSGAKRVQRRFRSCFDHLRAFPASGRPTRNPRIRRVVATPFPYLIFYEIGGNAVIVVAVRHGSREPSSMPGGGLD